MILKAFRICGLDVKPLGDKYKVVCPFHPDKNPSLIIYPATDSWSCFGCNAGGDAAALLMRYLNIHFDEAKNRLDINMYIHPVKPVTGQINGFKVNLSHDIIDYWHSMLGDHRKYFYQRGFKDEMIDSQKWGFDGWNYVLPIWAGEPNKSECLSVRLRKQNGSDGPKYKSIKGFSKPALWGIWYCRNAKTVLVFAGELDAAMAVQDGFAAISLVGGINAKLPKSWTDLLSTVERLIIVFDRGEEAAGGRIAREWNKIKGYGSAKIFHWPIDGQEKDYCEFRKEYSKGEFNKLITS